jgi:serine/threonine protein kinase
MATLRPPFTGSSIEDLYKSVLKGRYSPIPKSYSNELAAIIGQCLQVNPTQRPSTG